MAFYPRGTIPESLEVGVFYQTVKERSGLKTPREIDQYLAANAGPRYPELSLLAYGKFYSWAEFVSKFGDFNDEFQNCMIIFQKDNYETDWTDFIKELARGPSNDNDDIDEIAELIYEVMSEVPSYDQIEVCVSRIKDILLQKQADWISRIEKITELVS